MLKGNFLHRRIDADAKKSHTNPNAQKTSAVINPMAYTVGMTDLSRRKLVLANVSFAVSPSFKALDAKARVSHTVLVRSVAGIRLTRKRQIPEDPLAGRRSQWSPSGEAYGS